MDYLSNLIFLFLGISGCVNKIWISSNNFEKFISLSIQVLSWVVIHFFKEFADWWEIGSALFFQTDFDFFQNFSSEFENFRILVRHHVLMLQVLAESVNWVIVLLP